MRVYELKYNEPQSSTSILGTLRMVFSIMLLPSHGGSLKMESC